MKQTTPDQNSQPANRLQNATQSRLVRAFIAGVVLTLLSWVILGFNLSTGGSIKINDNVNRYFDSCVIETFVDGTPRIHTDDRGFPLAFVQTTHIPVCNDPGVEARSTSTTTIDWGSLGANILFWTCLTFWLMRKYTIRRALRITKNA